MRWQSGIWKRALGHLPGRAGELWCVGVIVLLGCFTMVIAPDEWPNPRAVAFTGGEPPTIIIDAGHGGNDEGTRSRSRKLQEKTVSLELALRLERLLRERGFHPVLTRREDRYVSLAERAAVANAVREPAVFISLHFNQGRGDGTSGIETFYAAAKTPEPQGWRWVGFFNPDTRWDSGENLAAEVQAGLVAQTGARDRGIRARDLYVCRNTRHPAILVEGGFLSNTMEARLLENGDYLERLARGIADGLESWRETLPRPAPMLAKNR